MSSPLWRLTTARRRLFEWLGSDRYSKPAYENIDTELAKLFSGAPGFFVEAGAVDGVFESNTYYLERFCGWRGVLVEPVPEMYRRIGVNRSARAFNCALVAEGGPSSIKVCSEHALSRVASSGITVPARTLSSILDEVGVSRVDLLSLDVEGFEIEVLKGIAPHHRIQHLLIECLTEQSRVDLEGYLGNSYTLIRQFTYRDFLYKRL